MIRRLSIGAATTVAMAAIAGSAIAGSDPSVQTGRATQVTQRSAVLHGQINPEGASTTYYFQWGLTNGYGTNGPPRALRPTGTVQQVSQNPRSLAPGTVYHYRLVATNRFGTAFGADRDFKTAGHAAPGALTGSAVNLATNGATLTGAVYPQGQQTTWYFQWGTSLSYTQRTAPQQTGATGTPQGAVSSLQGLLAPGTVYHFRLVAVHRHSATSLGSDAVFMTYPSPRPVPQVTASTTPFRARSRPYVLTTTGQVLAPAAIPSQFGCNGNVTIRFFRGLKQVGFTLAGIQPNCSFSARTVFQTIPGGRRLHPHRPVQLRVVVRSISNNYLATNKPPNYNVKLG
ncbi:MAG TPA: hypothetical protein VGF81_14045 [Solirubrobacteraceae bacterium]|jgi:hypothetical protein